MARHILVIDQGTTSTRSIVFDASVAPVAAAQQEFIQIYPRPGWVEHDPEEIWNTALATVRLALADAGLTASDIAAIGIANQRETVVVWDRRSGKAIPTPSSGRTAGPPIPANAWRMPGMRR